MRPSVKKITVGARASPLSQAQVHEVLSEIQLTYPEISFELLFIDTVGDRDQNTSLRTLDKTDFFTKDIDQMQLQGLCRIAIHSAKDLPDPLPRGLKLAALTKGVDSSDALVLREGETLSSLPSRAKIGTSSFRREEMVRKLREDLTFVDIRGTIEKRLEKLMQRQVDGVVIAEAALIRLKWTHVNRIKLPGDGAPMQGKLAIIVRDSDEEMFNLFKILGSS